MDDRNLVAVAEQAAATSRVRPGGHFAGCTVKADDGRVFRGCVLEYQDPALDQDPIANAIASARSDGVRKIVRIGLYSSTGGDLPQIPFATLRRMEELAAPGLAVIFSPGTGERVEKSLDELLQEATEA